MQHVTHWLCLSHRWKREPRSQRQRTNNIFSALDFLSKREGLDVKKEGISARGLMEGESECVCAFVWLLILRYQVSCHSLPSPTHPHTQTHTRARAHPLYSLSLSLILSHSLADMRW